MKAILRGILVSVGLALAAAPALAQARDLGAAVELRKLKDDRLGAGAAGTYRNFSSRKLYFGAFVWNSTTDAASFWRNVPSLADAVAFAKADCERQSGRRGRCEVYAVMVPRGFPRDRLTGTGLAQDVAKVFRGDFARKARTGKGYAAFATSGLGDYGFGWGYGTRQEAEEAATLQCLAGMAQSMADYQPEMRRIVQRGGANQCAVVDVRRN